MSDLTIQQLLEMAVRQRQAGNLPEAESLCRQILMKSPEHPDALHLSGLMSWQMGMREPAMDWLHRAITADPKRAEFVAHLGLMLAAMGRASEAVVAYRQSLNLDPNRADVCLNLGNALYSSRQIQEAIATFRRAIQLKPDFVEAHFNLGNALREAGQVEEAISSYRNAINIKADFAPAYRQLGVTLRAIGHMEEAIAIFRQAAKWWPNDADDQHNLASALRTAGQTDEAIAAYRRAIELRPQALEVYLNLGGALQDLGQSDEALQCYEHFLTGRPDSPVAASHRLYILHLRDAYRPGPVFEEHRKWSRQFAEPLREEIRSHGNERSPDRILRVGYVSPDLHLHPVSFFFQSLLKAHDPTTVEVYCYADIPQPDEVTGRLKKMTPHWRDITRLDDARSARIIREDKIDILIDLAGHTFGNRLLAFARRPAPVQATYLGYPDTTGLETMDYRITDGVADPPEMTEGFHTEKLARLPGAFLCAAALDANLPTTPLPSLANGFVTFGSFNALSKITDGTVELWASILSRIPRSRMIIKSHSGLDNASPRERILKIFNQHGVDPMRVEILGRISAMSSHLELYGQIDLALDTHPYNGTTITCESLWMGVPVIALAGAAHVSRVGASLASNAGLAEFVADSRGKYVELAVDWAGRGDELAKIRATLRERLKSTPFIDARKFARNVEAVYRQMWLDWLAK